MSLRILLVENDPATADVLAPSLERKGYQVSVARTQRQVINRSRSLRPDILVLDVASFGTNGYKVSAAIRSRLERVPTVLLIERSIPGMVGDGDEFMVPPFTSRKLLHRVKKLAEQMVGREIVMGPLSLDPDTRTLTKCGVSCHLRPKEASLLELFFLNAGRILSRSEIVRQVWETEYTGDTRTLSVHVRWLRAKIEDDPGKPQFLRTVRGVGYRFDVPGEGERI